MFADRYLDGGEMRCSSPNFQLHRPDVLLEHSLQMIGGQDKKMIKVLFSYGSDPKSPNWTS